MKRLTALGFLLLVAAAGISLLPGTETAQAATTDVSVNNNFFSAAAVTVTVGDTVHWNWVGSNHSVTADDASFDSGVQNAGATFDRTFTTPGTFRYYCKIHGGPGGLGMSGTITVQAAAATPTNTTQPTSTNTATATATGQSTATATGTATMTPTAATRATTPLVSSTPLPSASASPNTPAPAVTAAGPTSPGGGVAGVGAALPSTGDGSSAGMNPLQPLGVLLAVCGIAAIGAGFVWKRRRV